MPVPGRGASESDWRAFFDWLPSVLNGSEDALVQAMLLYVQALERERSDRNVATLLADKVVETGSLTELGIHIYLHACYVCGAHDRLFTYVGSLIDSKRYEGLTESDLRGRCPSQFLMYRYDKEFIERVVSEISLPAVHQSPLIVRRHTKLAVITGCDDRYFKRYLFDSILRLSVTAECLLHLALIDGANDTLERLETISSNTANVVYSHTLHASYYPPEELSYISSLERRITTCACHRFFIAERVLLNSNCPVVLLDSDTDFESIDFESLIKAVNVMDCDVGIARWDLDDTPGTSFLADVVVVRPTEAGRTFIRLLTRYCYFYISRGLGFWTLDQVALNAIHHYSSTADIQYRNLDLSKAHIKRECNIRHITSERFRQES
jgi:hypothetical protein